MSDSNLFASLMWNHACWSIWFLNAQEAKIRISLFQEHVRVSSCQGAVLLRHHQLRSLQMESDHLHSRIVPPKCLRCSLCQTQKPQRRSDSHRWEWHTQGLWLEEQDNYSETVGPRFRGGNRNIDESRHRSRLNSWHRGQHQASIAV